MTLADQGFKQFRVSLAIAALLFPVAVSAQIPKDLAWTTLKAGASDSNPRERAAAIRSLGLIPEDPVVEKLALDSLSDSATEVRAAAASALGQMGAKSSIPRLQEVLKDKEVEVVLAAAGSLRRLGDPAAYLVYYAVLTGERKSGEGLLAEEKKMLNDPQKMATFGFEQGIGFIPFAGLGYSTLKMLTKDDVSPVRAAAAAALAEDKDPKSAEALVRATSDPSWIVRAAALDAIARRGDPHLVPKIVRKMSDPKSEVKYTAAAAVYRLSRKSTGRPR
jgi:HEAT repeat protein